jgi:hypothetical protein
VPIELNHEQIVALLQDEYRYWSNAEGQTPQQDAIFIGAAGAIGNVIGTLMTGRPAPWHTSHPLFPVPLGPADIAAFTRCPCPSRRDEPSTDAIVL